LQLGSAKPKADCGNRDGIDDESNHKQFAVHAALRGASRRLAFIIGNRASHCLNIIKNPNWPAVTLVAAVATLASAPFLIFGAPYGDDLHIHLSWSHQFALQLWSGDAYPRWLSELNGGAGSPTFFYYAPFPYYVSGVFGPLLCPGCRPETHLAIGLWLLLLGSGIAFYAFGRRYGGPSMAAAGAIVYMLMPYHYESDLWRRICYGEFAAYVWMPLILLALDKTLEDRRYLPACAVAYAGLLLSHLPATLLFSLLLAAYALLQCVLRKSWRPVLLLAAMVALGGGLASLYLVPALAAQHYVYAPQMYDPHATTAHRLWNYEFFNYRNWLFLDGRPSPVPRFAVRVRNGLIYGTVMFALLSAVVYRAKGWQAWRDIAPWLLALAIVWFVVTPLSIPLFELVPLFKQVDFPFRIVIVADFAVAALFVVALQEAWQRRDRVSQVLVGLAGSAVLGSLVLSGGPFHYHLNRFYRLLAPFQRQDVVEKHAAMLAAGWDSLEFFMPVWTTLSFEDFRIAVTKIPRVQVVAQNAGEVRIERWAPRDIQLHVDLQRATPLTVRQFYFPGWRARNMASGTELAVSPRNPTGLVTIEAPPGRYDIDLRLTPLWQERMGDGLSVVSLLVLGGLVLIQRRR
jgi:hypothetical protein